MSKKTILVVDDEPANLTVLGEILSPEYKVIVANSGLQALQNIQSKPDIILLDIMMPDMDGFEVLTKIKQKKASSDIPVIFITAMNKIQDEQKGLDLGAVDYITKPIQPKILLARLKAQLALKQMQDLLGSQNTYLESEIAKRLKENEDIQSQLMAAQKLEVMGRLAAGIAHEINTPMQFISDNMEFLKEASEEAPKLINQILNLINSAPEEIKNAVNNLIDDADWDFYVKEQALAIEQSKEGIQRVNGLIRAMKSYSHPGTKEKTLLNINQIIKTAITLSRNEWKYIAEISFDSNPDLPELLILGDEMGQVFINILVNAAHAIEEENTAMNTTKKGLISINTKYDDEQIEIIISDNGPGMTKKRISKIFEPFFTTKDVGKGTGQGLAIAHDIIVIKHSGTLRCESELGKGTDFIICLPTTL